MKYVLMALFIATLVSCKADKETPEAIDNYNDAASDITITSYDYNGFKPFLEKQDGKVHIINFWATWCKPCVEELPYFEMINSQYSNEDVTVTLVSLDMPSMVDGHVIPFVKKNQIKSDVILLDDPDANCWIRDINAQWTGAIPATIIYKNGKQKFYEQTFTFNQLQKELKSFL